MTATIRRLKARKPPQPVHGSVKWVRRFGTLAAPNLAIISLNGREYFLVDGDAGYHLLRQGDSPGEVHAYDLPHDLSGCTCPDTTFAPYREGGCKHRRSLAVLGLARKEQS